MSSLNVAILRGVVSSAPRVRTLPSGGQVTNIEVTTDLERGRVSVPVVVHDRDVSIGEGDEIVVTGHVARRFFRAGGVTQSRTEIVADRIVRAAHRRRAERALDQTVAAITG